jgi:hypothetical protein
VVGRQDLVTPPLDRVPVQIHPTEEFDRALDTFLDEVESAEPDSQATKALVKEFEDELASALTNLKNKPLDVKPHGDSGSEFSYPLSEALSLIFQRTTDRTGAGKPLKIHFYLLAIERNP